MMMAERTRKNSKTEEESSQESPPLEEDSLEGSRESAGAKDVKGKRQREEKGFDPQTWHPRTTLGKAVKEGTIKHIDEILDEGRPILEAEIVDTLLPNLQTDLLLIGQAKGKFGGGQRRVFKQTQKKTREGNKPKFSTFAVVGNMDGYVGVGHGKAKETVPAREKAIRNAKLNIVKIRRGSGSWQSNSTDQHSLPFRVRGKCGSVIIDLIPAPKGTGLVVEKECQKLLRLAGIQDVWSRTRGQTNSKLNTLYACFAALRELIRTRVREQDAKATGMAEGSAANVKAGES